MSFDLRTVLVFLPYILLGADFSTYPTLIRLNNGMHAWIKQSLGSLGLPQAKKNVNEDIQWKIAHEQKLHSYIHETLH